MGLFSFPPFAPEGQVLFNQSLGQGWGREDGGVVRQPGMREQGEHIRGISTSQMGW